MAANGGDFIRRGGGHLLHSLLRPEEPEGGDGKPYSPDLAGIQATTTGIQATTTGHRAQPTAQRPAFTPRLYRGADASPPPSSTGDADEVGLGSARRARDDSQSTVTR
jgi:hypothetical protein